MWPADAESVLCAMACSRSAAMAKNLGRSLPRLKLLASGDGRDPDLHTLKHGRKRSDSRNQTARNKSIVYK